MCGVIEIDILERNDSGRMNAYEIKSAMSYHRSLVANLEEYIQKWDAESQASLIYDGRNMTTGSGVRCVNFRDL